jgi:hypothetical protein
MHFTSPNVVQASVVRTGGKTIMRFTRPYDATFTGKEPINALAAYSHAGDDLVAVHDNREPFQLSLTGDAVAEAGEDPVIKWRRVHAVLMIMGWGVLLPLGVAMANTLRTYGPVWYCPSYLLPVSALHARCRPDMGDDKPDIACLLPVRTSLFDNSCAVIGIPKGCIPLYMGYPVHVAVHDTTTTPSG